MYEVALNILNKLENMGYIAYIIGGYPRDKYLGIESTDIDICTSCKPDKLKELFDVVEDNSMFGSLRIKENNYIYEITTFRIDVEYKGRYPKIEYTDSLIEDLKRRDFTINTICVDKNGEYVDLLNGIEDINKKVIRCIGDVNTKLTEDPLRMLRAIRFMGKLNFGLDNELKECIIKDRCLIESLSKNSIKRELDKMNDISINILKEYKLDEYLKELI